METKIVSSPTKAVDPNKLVAAILPLVDWSACQARGTGSGNELKPDGKFRHTTGAYNITHSDDDGNVYAIGFSVTRTPKGSISLTSKDKKAMAQAANVLTSKLEANLSDEDKAVLARVFGKALGQPAPAAEQTSE